MLPTDWLISTSHDTFSLQFLLTLKQLDVYNYFQRQNGCSIHGYAQLEPSHVPYTLLLVPTTAGILAHEETCTCRTPPFIKCFILITVVGTATHWHLETHELNLLYRAYYSFAIHIPFSCFNKHLA